MHTFEIQCLVCPTPSERVGHSDGKTNPAETLSDTLSPSAKTKDDRMEEKEQEKKKCEWLLPLHSGITILFYQSIKPCSLFHVQRLLGNAWHSHALLDAYVDF